ncbi:MAG: hypothetical protein PHS41_10040, partial [Victivallaceae bacterium]|nr:hypothetical protein [Victivallaceae bacterium]
IHSRLKTVALAVSSGDDFFLTASIDNVGCPQQFVDRLRKEVAALEPSIDPSKVFVNAIHSHNAPSLAFQDASVNVANRIWDKSAQGEWITPELYADFAIPIIAGNIVNAWRNRQAGGIAPAFGNARIGHCRRAVYADGTAEMYGDTTRPDFVGMEAGEDSAVEMLFTFDDKGRRTGMLLNTACPSQSMEATNYVSSDFAGAAREKLKNLYGKEFHTLYQISPAGCQSPRDLVRHYTTEPDFWHADGVEVLADRLVAAVSNATPGPIETAPVFRSVFKTVSLPRRRASYVDYKKAESELAALLNVMSEDQAFQAFCDETHAREKVGGPGPYDSKLHSFVKIKNAQAVIRRYLDQDENPRFVFQMNLVRIGNCVIAGNPFELYLSYGQNIKARSKAFQTFLVELSGGGNFHAGYLPSPAAERFGGYGGFIVNGQVGSDGGFLLADRTVEEINALFDQSIN